MTEITDYAALAKELFQTPWLKEHHIEGYNLNSNHRGLVFYEKLVMAMLENDNYKSYSIQTTESEKKPIIAKIKGVLLFVDVWVKPGEVMAVIGPPGEDYKKVIEAGDSKKNQIIRRSHFNITPETWESVRFDIVPNTSEFAGISEVNIPVNKNEILGYTSIKEYSTIAKLFRNRYQSIFDYCKRKIEELTPDNVFTATKKETPKTATAKKKITCRQYALYYHFLWLSGEIEGFKSGDQMKWLKAISIECGIDFENLKKYWKGANDNKILQRGTKENIGDLETAIALLGKNPKSKILANDAIKKAKENQK